MIRMAWADDQVMLGPRGAGRLSVTRTRYETTSPAFRPNGAKLERGLAASHRRTKAIKRRSDACRCRACRARAPLDRAV